MNIQERTNTVAILEALRNDDLHFDKYIDQIETHFNTSEPEILAFLPEKDRFGRLQREAGALEEKYPDSANRPALYGLVIGVKDIFRVDGFETRAGSQLPTEDFAGKEAECVSALRNAGALVLGKTVTTEFAYFAPGPTRNPHDLAHTPGGSSSGSAAGVAAGMTPLAFGTQTIGSVIRPASYCGVVGFKPSFNRISKAGVIPLAPSLDHVGFFAQDLEMAHLAASILCGDWHEPAATEEKPALGIPEGAYLQKASAEMLQHFLGLVSRLENAGYEVKYIPVMPDFGEIVLRHNIILAAEAAHTHKSWYRNYADKYHTKTKELIEEGKNIPKSDLIPALEGPKILRDQLSRQMKDHNIDLWLSPAATGAAPKGLESTGDPVMNLPWTQAGLPTLNLPAGKNENSMPLGLQIAAGWYEDENLFTWANDIAASLN